MTAPDPAPRPARLRLDHVDGMRAAAALVVYLNHAYAQTWGGSHHAKGLFAPASYSMVAGHLAVTVFIVISGFCLALPVIDSGELRGGVKAFFKRRARRILPPYYAAVALCLILIATVIGEPTGTLWDVPIKVTLTSIVSHLLLFQDLFGTSHINYVFWSIAVEWHIYFVMPLLVWGWRRFGAVPVVIGALVVGYALRLGFADTRLYRAHPHYLGMFAMGMLAAYAARSSAPAFVKLRPRVPWALIGAAGFLATAVAIPVWGIGVSGARLPLLDLIVGTMTLGILVASSRSDENLLARGFGWRPLVFVGSFSYSLYLIHAPLLQILWQYGAMPLGLGMDAMFFSLMTAGLALVLGASYLFHLAFEAPFMSNPARAARLRPV